MHEETIAFQTIPVGHQNRFKDRISFLYLEYSRIIQSDSGVIALSSETHDSGVSKIDIPVAGIAVLILGPGTSITNAALTSCARSGCVVQFTGGGGMPLHSTITPLTSDPKWAIAQATVTSNNTEAKKVAKRLYVKQFGVPGFDGSITQMRGIEGSLIRKIYQTEAKKNNIKGWRRDTLSEDNVNMSLNIMNGILYGLSSSAIQALGMNPSLGIIHRGHVRSFLFDIADLYKPQIVIPLAFSLSDEDPERLQRAARISLRRELHKHKVMEDIIKTVTSLLEPYLPEGEGYRLIGTSSEVPGQVNYGSGEELVF